MIFCMFEVAYSVPEVIKLFSYSVEHEILNAHKYKLSRNSAFLGSDKPRMLFFRSKMLKCQQLLAF